ncbi:MAG: hypothetical protein HYX67_05785 [Candidatus Melainabacteria bacterium]|nr:hypothetical protein [Candidatus Melainabacteria bacterium]
MSDFEEKTKIDSELFLRETPDVKVRNQLSKMKEPHSSVSFGGMQQVTPPARDGKVRKPETAADKRKRIKTLLLIVLATVGAIALMNYRRVADLTYTGMATLEMMKGDLNAAAEHYKAAYSANPDDVNPLLLAASIHLGQKNDQLAEEEFSEVFRSSKNPAFTHNQRAKILSGMGRTKEALDEWGEAVHLKPNYTTAHAQRALAFTNQKRFGDAIAEWDETIKSETDPKETFALSHKAQVLGEMKQYHEAMLTIEEALVRNPTDPKLLRQRDFYRSHL